MNCRGKRKFDSVCNTRLSIFYQLSDMAFDRYNHQKSKKPLKYQNQTFDNYARTFILPARSMYTVENSLYAKHLETWFQLFRRDQILVLSYDEVLHNSTKARERVELFLGQRFPAIELEKHNTQDYEGKVLRPACSIQQELDKLFRPHNDRLYALLSRGGRPEMEQDPFPKFRLGKCIDYNVLGEQMNPSPNKTIQQ